MPVEKITLLTDKRILLGVTGSIAVYKAVDLASKLTQHGARVDVIMTAAAQQFITPLTFQSVTGQPVYTAVWQTENSGGLPTHIAHVGLGEGSDVFIVAPATANTLAKFAHGLSDDLLSITALAVRCPLIIAPAMDGGMYAHPATQANLKLLIERGATLIEPAEGRFASGLIGKGRLPETLELIGVIRHVLARRGPLAGRKIVVTAGGTKEAIDPVRFISNHSSGKQGHALAWAALDAGAKVVLITTTDVLEAPYGAHIVRVNSAQEMLNAVQEHGKDADALIMAAAVADFAPAAVADQKIKKSADNQAGLTLQLTRTPDILSSMKVIRSHTGFPRVVVGFAAESQDLPANAQDKLERKELDFIVANDITAPDAGFNVETNRVIILDKSGSQKALDLMSKTRVAEIVIERVAHLLNP